MVSILHDHTILQIYTRAAKKHATGSRVDNRLSCQFCKSSARIHFVAWKITQRNKQTHIYTPSYIYIYMYVCVCVRMYVCIRVTGIPILKWTNLGKYEPVKVHWAYPLLMGAGNLRLLPRDALCFLQWSVRVRNVLCWTKTVHLQCFCKVSTTEICRRKFCKKYAASIVLCTRTMYRTVEKLWITYSVPNEKKIRKLYTFN
jgi:hypothetical protein